MTETMKMLRLWDGWDRFPGGRPFPRKEKQVALKRLSANSGLLLRGCRGVGKSTLLRILAMDFHSHSMPRESIVFIDLEDPLWAPRPSIGKLNSVLTKHGANLLLLDGVERLEGWEKFVQYQIDRGTKIIASMTGKRDAAHIKGMDILELFPMDLASWIRLFTDKKVDNETAQRHLSRYLMAGGLPVSRNANGRRQALVELLYSSLLKDVLMSKGVRTPEILTAMAVYLMGMTGRPISAARLRGSISRSMDQARMLLGHLAESGLVDLVSRLEDAGRSSNQAARLAFACDTGLAVALSPGLSVENTEGLSSLALTAVYHNLLRMGKRVWAWRLSKRHGLAVGDGGGKVELMIDVNMNNGPTDSSILRTAMRRYGCEDGLMLTAGDTQDSKEIKQEPLWSWLLLESAGISNNTETTAKPVKMLKPSKQLPPHLL